MNILLSIDTIKYLTNIKVKCNVTVIESDLSELKTKRERRA